MRRAGKLTTVKISARVAVVLLALMSVTGCTRAVAGTVQPAPGLTPKPVTGQAVKKVLPDGAQLAKILGQEFEQESYLPTKFGSVDALYDVLSDASPRECAGVASGMGQSTYQDSDVVNIAQALWWSVSGSSAKESPIMEADVGVVALKSTADANALFDEFSEQWPHCDGTAVRGNSRTYQISDVQAGDSVLSARTDWGFYETRALGVRVNCIVEVTLTYYSSTKSKWSQETKMVDLAHALMDQVSDLS